MIRNRRASIGLVAAAVIVAATTYIIHEASLNRSLPVPDLEVRQAVAGIQAKQIALVALSTWPRHLIVTPTRMHPATANLPPEFGTYGATTTSPRAIQLLLRGLREATIPEDGRTHSANRIILVLRGGRMVGPFNFGAKRKIDCFSPTFVEGMKAAGAKVPKL